MTQSETEFLVSVSGGCHCGAVRFSVRLPRAIEVSHCNCSICDKTGFVHVIVPGPRFELLSSATELTEYRFHTGAARHLFCRHCGIKSFYVPRSHPEGFSVNLNCLRLPEDLAVAHSDFDGRHWSRNISKLLDSKAGGGRK